MKTELNLKKVVIAGLLLSAPVTVLAGGGQAFKDQVAHGTSLSKSEHVRDWSAIDANGDHFISANEMEAYLIKQRGKTEAATGTDPQANLSQADKLYTQMMNSAGIRADNAAPAPSKKAPEQWNQVEKLYWALQPSEAGGFLTAGAGKFQWQLDSASRDALLAAGNDRVMDSTDLGMYFKHGAGKHQPTQRIYIPGATFTVEIPAAGKHQSTTMPGNLVEFESAKSAQGG